MDQFGCCGRRDEDEDEEQKNNSWLRNKEICAEEWEKAGFFGLGEPMRETCGS